MRLTRAAEYAIRCMIHLCRQGRGSLASRQAIADQAGIPAHFLAKIAQDLAKAGFIEIRQGANITLLEVVETMIGEIHLNDCIARPAGCQHSYHCAVHRVWLDARDQLRETLRRVSFDQLLNDTSCLPAYGDDLMEAECLDSPAPLQGELQ
jgi:Rrf2 family protein